MHIRTSTEEFRNFIRWMIDTARLLDNWTHIRRVYEKPWLWTDEYQQFLDELPEPNDFDGPDEAQEWDDYDPGEVMESMYGE